MFFQQRQKNFAAAPAAAEWEGRALRKRVPDYYGDFRCLAGACPRNCCTGWEVVVDPATAARYRALPGPFGERLRAALRRDEDGEDCFPLRGGRCPFLDGENLCEIYRRLGEAATSDTCRAHPRFIEDYGPFREISLAASCPAACRLLLGSRAPLAFLEEEEPGGAEPGDPWLEPLLAVRGRMFRLLTARPRPLRRRLREVLELALAAQELLDEDRAEALPALAESWTPGAAAPGAGPGLFPEALDLLGELEILESDWPELLAAGKTAAPAPQDEALLERLAAYFLFRYGLKAVNDGDLAGRIALCLLAVLTAERLAAVCGLEAASERFSREIEHDQENLDALQAAFWEDPRLSPARFRRELGHG